MMLRIKGFRDANRAPHDRRPVETILDTIAEGDHGLGAAILVNWMQNPLTASVARITVTIKSERRLFDLGATWPRRNAPRCECRAAPTTGCRNGRFRWVPHA